MVSTVYTFSIVCASAAFLAGCNDRQEADRAEERARRAEEARDQQRSGTTRMPEVDAAALALAVDPPAPPGDLKNELAGYTTLEACVRARAATLDPLLSDTLGALGYDTFLRDSCRLLDAAKREDPAACAPIGSSQLRARCQQWVAIVRADPDACPLEGQPEDGREPLCLALAARDAHACQAAPSDRRAMCLAVVKGDPRACAASAHPEPCAREATRLGALTVAHEARVRPTVLPAASAHLELHGIDGSAEPAAGNVQSAALLRSAERGAVTVRSKTSQSVTFGQPDELGSTRYTPPAQGGADVSLQVRLTGDAAQVERLELTVPGAGIFVVPGAAWEGTAKLVGDAATRGAPCHLTVHGKIGVAPQTYQLDLDVQTYIRDAIDGELPALPLSGVLRHRDERDR
jgi:hypothetical protein